MPEEFVDAARTDATSFDAASLDASPIFCEEAYRNWTELRVLQFNNLSGQDTSYISGGLDSMPVFVRLSESGINAEEALLGKIRISDGQGGEIPYELEGDILWFPAPNIPANSGDTKAYIYTGNPQASEKNYEAADVWTNYIGVWHFHSEASKDGSLSITDSLGNWQVGNLVQEPGEDLVAVEGLGVLGGAIEIPYADVFFNVPWDSSEAPSLSELSLEVRLRMDVTNANAGVAGLISMGGQVSAFARRSQASPGPSIFARQGSSALLLEAAAPDPIDGWAYIAGTVDNNPRRVRLYANGEIYQDENAMFELLSQTITPLEVGRGMNGILDELRISRIVRDAAWVSAQNRVFEEEFVQVGQVQEHSCE